MLAQNLDAFGAGLCVVGEHAAEGDDKARIAGIAGGGGAHGVQGLVFAVGSGVEGFVIGQGDVAVRRMVAIVLAINAHGGFRIAGLGQCASLAETHIAGLIAGETSNLANVGVVGVDFAQLV